LLASSAAVYGAQSGLLTEEGTCHPVSDYGQAKLDMETRGAALSRKLQIGVSSLRIANIAGADAILGNWREGFALDRFADGQTPRRSYIGPATLAEVMTALSAANGLPDILNIAAPGVTAMGDLLDEAGLAWSPRPAPSTAIPEITLSTERLEHHVPLDVGDGTPRSLVAQWRQATGA
jgi:nucleoside-diphosphate-sugar epimerase